MSCENNTKIREALRVAVEGTFMDMAFIDVIESKSEKPVESSGVLYIAFSHPVDGGMILRLPMECKRMIVENIHAADWEDLSSEEKDDCLLEALNVLAGNFLNAYCGKESSHNMSFPQMLFDEEEISGQNSYESFRFDAEGVIFQIDLCVEVCAS